jgi:thioredoxin-like negative regulator of GroEL
MMIRHTNDELLDRLLADLIVGPGCFAIAFMGHFSEACTHFWPEIRAVAHEWHKKIKFYSIDAIENPTLTDQFGVTAVPTLIVFKGGDEVARYEGPYSREALRERLGKLVGKKA